MPDFLILKLQGVMQSWGEHTYEGLRPSANFPTRSALVGLLGACLGIERTDSDTQQDLADSFQYAARRDTEKPVWVLNADEMQWKYFTMIKITDYHTVKNARKEYAGLQSHETIQTWREYLLDAAFTVALWNTEQAVFSLDKIKEALMKPEYTPFLGRRSCPLGRPLFDSRVSAENVEQALLQCPPANGVIYSEQAIKGARKIKIRDVPLTRQPRQFASRMVYISGSGG